MRGLTAHIGQTDGSSLLVWMRHGRLCPCRGQVYHADLGHALHRGGVELRHVHRHASLSQAVIHEVVMMLEPEAARKKNKQKGSVESC